MGELREINVGMIKDRLIPLPLSTSDDNQIPEMIGADRWGVAEKETQRIVSQFQATVVSEERRREVIGYVQRLLRECLGCEVFPYGSVPLKTYLPDGDIDLTVFGGASGEDTLANDIISALEAVEKNINAEFVVKDVQLVRAEVKLVKCIVQNIVVDISLNQIGGLSTLCFLEQLDRVIGKDHLFKQSIILIKAWCFYESRILGAHHGLISTYALETLVLYIFHVFHSSLDGPLAVLYRFLDYFSKFDWETYCISLNGPVRISALPDLSAEMPQQGTHDLLLGKDFLNFCSENFSVPLRGVEMNSRAFPPKYLNIVDPLKDNNNLGRSVSKGNFYRIRSAFTFGAKKLGRILTSPVDDIARELQMFFSSTLVRHGNVQRPDVEVSPPRSTLNGKLRSSIGFSVLVGHENLDKNMVFLENRVTGDAKDLATFRLEGLKISKERTKISPPRDKEIVRPARMPPHAPHLYFSKEWLANRKTKDGDIDENQSENFEKNKVVNAQGILETNCSDLSGDFQSHLISLQRGRWCYEYPLSVRVVAAMSPPSPPPIPPTFEGIKLWGPLRHPFQQFKRNRVFHANVNGVTLNPMFYIPSQMLAPRVAFGSEEMPKHRGTGAYFPNLKGMNLGQAARLPHTNSQAFEYFEKNMHDRSNLEDQLLGTDQIHQSYSHRQKLNPNANGFISHPEITVAESGAVDHQIPSSGPLVLVSSWQPKSTASLRPQMTGQGSPAPTIQRLNSVPHPDRLTVKKSYHLKDEDDFPPLSSF